MIHFKKPNQKDSKLLGVCSSIAETFDWNVDIVRLGFICSFFYSASGSLLLYIFLAIVIAVMNQDVPNTDNNKDAEIVKEEDKIDHEKVKEADVFAEEDVTNKSENK